MTRKRAIGRSRASVAGVAAALAVVLTAAAPALAGGRAPSWHVIKTFTPHNTFMIDVVGFRDGTAWAGGESPSQAPVLHHLTGRTWHTVSLPGPLGAFVANLSASSPGNVWAALANEPLVAHLTRSGWVTKSFAHGTDQIFSDSLVTTGPKDTWVFTFDFATKRPVAEHFNGSKWTSSPLPAPVDCDCATHATSASSATNVWAWVFTSKGFETMRWNGRKWRIVSLPRHLVPAGQKVGGLQMLAESATNVWATADNTMSTGSIILLHWNGRTWAKIGGRLPKGQLAGPIAADGHGGLWLVGRTPAFSDFILHYASGRWTRSPVPTDGSDTVVVNALRLISGSKTVLGVGNLSPNFGGDNGAVVVEFGR